MKPGPTPTISEEDNLLPLPPQLPLCPPMMTSWPVLVSQLSWKNLLSIVAWLVQVEVPGAQTRQEVFVSKPPPSVGAPPKMTMPADVRSAREKLALQGGTGLSHLQSVHIC